MSAENDFRSVGAITNLWAGAFIPRTTASSAWADRFDAALHEAVSGPHPLLLIGRNSNSSGRRGAVAAVDDLFGAADALSRSHGWDVRPLLPTRQQLVEHLMDSKMVVHSQKLVDGVRHGFINRFALVDLRHHGLVVSLSAGSAKSLTLDFNQPHVSWLERLIEEDGASPGALFAKRDDRIYREGWSVGGLLLRLRAAERQRPLWVGDGMFGRWDLSPDQDIVRFVKGKGAEQEAAAFEKKRVDNQRSLTGTQMVDYEVAYALGHGAPPGTFRYRPPSSQRFILAIDTPDLYPQRHDIHGLPPGVPQVVDAQDKLVDQVATIRWLLSNLGRPGLGFPELWNELLARRYSTETLRLQDGQGPGAYYGGPTKPATGHKWDPVASWTRSIIDNLELYETGVLRRSLGPGQEPVVITNVFPPGGSWAEPEDFARIRRYLRRRRQARDKARSWSWSGLPVTVNGTAGRIRNPSPSRSDEPVRWPVSLEGPLLFEGHRGTSGFAPTIPDDKLTEGILNSLQASSGEPLTRVLQRPGSAVRAAELDQQIREAEMLLGQARVKTQALLEDAYALDASGQLVLPEAVRRQLLAKSSEGAAEQQVVESSLRTLTEERLGLTADTGAGAADVRDLQEVLRGLRNPACNTTREGLRRLLTRLDFTVTPTRRERLRGYAVRFEGEFTISTSSGPHTVPFVGAYETGAAAEAQETASAGVEALRAGELPLHYRRHSRKHVGVVLALRALDQDPETFRWRVCEDSALLRLAMAALFPVEGECGEAVPGAPKAVTDDELIRDFTDVAGLGRRIRAIHATSRTPRWLKKDEAAMEVECMIASIQQRHGSDASTTYTARQLNGLRQRLKVDPDRTAAWLWPTMDEGQLQPCPSCASPWLVPMLFAEAAGYVCLSCRRDRAGVTWPQRFDRFIAKRDLWLAAGAPIPDADLPPRLQRPQHSRRARNQAGAPDAAVRAAVLDQYVNRKDLTVQQIVEANGIHAHTLMALVREAGVPTRYAKTSRRWSEATPPSTSA